MKLRYDTSVCHYSIYASNYYYGRLCAYVIYLFSGKDSTLRNFYNPNKYIVRITNLSNVKFSNDKKKLKLFRHHTGRMGGLKEITMQTYIDKDMFKKCFLVSLRRMCKKTTNFKNILFRNLIIEL